MLCRQDSSSPNGTAKGPKACIQVTLGSFQQSQGQNQNSQNAVQAKEFCGHQSVSFSGYMLLKYNLVYAKNFHNSAWLGFLKLCYESGMGSLQKI